MPFQVVTSSYQVGPPPVVLLTAGADQAVFCGAVVVLEATVDDPANLPGHPLEWEQLSGNPVILSCPTCITTTYPLNDLTQKVFRFWIDRGLPSEQYDDVTIFHTPQSDMMPGAFENLKEEDYLIKVACSSPPCDSIIITVIEPPQLGSGQAPGALGLEWGEVARVDLRPFVTQYTVLEDGVPVQTSLVNEPREFAPTMPATYQIFTELFVNGAYGSELSCLVDYTGDLYPDVVVLDEYFAPGAFEPHQDRDLVLVKYANIVNSESVSSFEPGAFEPHQTRDLVTVRYSNIVVTEPESDMMPGAFEAMKAEDLVITRFDSGSIGG